MARVRRVAGTQERLLASPYTITQPHALRGHWQDAFPSPQPLVIEIGSGRGRWLYTAAARHPELNFLGIDVVPEIIMDAIDDHADQDRFCDSQQSLEERQILQPSKLRQDAALSRRQELRQQCYPQQRQRLEIHLE